MFSDSERLLGELDAAAMAIGQAEVAFFSSISLLIGLVIAYFGLRIYRLIFILAGIVVGLVLGVAAGGGAMVIVMGVIVGLLFAALAYYAPTIAVFVGVYLWLWVNLGLEGGGHFLALIVAVIAGALTMTILELVIIVTTAIVGAWGVAGAVSTLVGVFGSVGTTGRWSLSALLFLLIAATGIYWQFQAWRAAEESSDDDKPAPPKPAASASQPPAVAPPAAAAAAAPAMARPAAAVRAPSTQAASGDGWVLVATDGPMQGAAFDIHSDLVLGREADCAARLEDPAASRRHAKITVRADGALVITDQSTNGTWVNDRRIGSSRLALGDWVRVPGQTFRVGKRSGAARPRSSRSRA